MRKRNFILVCCCLWFVNIHAQNKDSMYNLFIRQADSLYQRGEYKESFRFFEKAFAVDQEIKPYHLYNAACVAALCGEKEQAFHYLYLRLNIETDWYNEDIGEDKDLVSIHTDPRWPVLIDSMKNRQKKEEWDLDQPLKTKLKAILKADQDVRLRYLSELKKAPKDSLAVSDLIDEMIRTDSINRLELIKIWNQKGWIGKEKVGKAVMAQWLIIQHADLEMQKKYLPLIRDAVKRGDIPTSQYAMLEDRINVREGRPQKYGTQILSDKNGIHYVAPLVDTLKVDDWRAEVGMIPMKEYVKRWKIQWPPTSK